MLLRTRNDRFGSIATEEVQPTVIDVRFAAKADKRQIVSVCPLCVKSGFMRRSKQHRHLITSSAIRPWPWLWRT
jgi:hypothetical protein